MSVTAGVTRAASRSIEGAELCAPTLPFASNTSPTRTIVFFTCDLRIGDLVRLTRRRFRQGKGDISARNRIGRGGVAGQAVRVRGRARGGAIDVVLPAVDLVHRGNPFDPSR